MLELIRPFIISFIIGMLVGLERETRYAKGLQAMGVRTFTLFALLGTLAAKLEMTTMAVVISGFVFLLILLSYLRTTDVRKQDASVGITTEMAAAVVFALGYIAFKHAVLALIIGLGVLLVLLGRHTLHKFAREKLKHAELRAAATILIVGLAVLSLLPNHSIDPWSLFNPQKFGMIVVLLSLIQFIGYVAVRVFGQRLGMLFLGFFGGVASSTSVFLMLPKYSRAHPAAWRPLVVAAIYAQIGSLVTLTTVVLVLIPELASTLLPIIGAIIVVGLLSGLLIASRKTTSHLPTLTENPLEYRSIFKLSLYIASMLIIVALTQRLLPESALNIVAFLGGLFESHSISIATATLAATQKIKLSVAELNICVIIAASIIAKLIILWVTARNRFALIATLFLVLMLAVGAAVFNLV